METEQLESTEKKTSKEDWFRKDELSIVCVLHRIKFRAKKRDKALETWEVDGNGFLGLEGRPQLTSNWWGKEVEANTVPVTSLVVAGRKDSGEEAWGPDRRACVLFFVVWRWTCRHSVVWGEAGKRENQRHEGRMELGEGSKAQMEYLLALEMRENFPLSRKEEVGICEELPN